MNVGGGQSAIWVHSIVIITQADESRAGSTVQGGGPFISMKLKLTKHTKFDLCINRHGEGAQ